MAKKNEMVFRVPRGERIKVSMVRHSGNIVLHLLDAEGDTVEVTFKTDATHLGYLAEDIRKIIEIITEHDRQEDEKFEEADEEEGDTTEELPTTKAATKKSAKTKTTGKAKAPKRAKKTAKPKAKKAGVTADAKGETEDKNNPKRTIGERISDLRDEAKILEMYLQESEFDDEDDGEGEDEEYWEADIQTATGLMQCLKEIGDPSPEVAALVVDYRPRPDWSDLDKARDIKDEIEEITSVFTTSGIEDKDFADALEGLGEWMCDL